MICKCAFYICVTGYRPAALLIRSYNLVKYYLRVIEDRVGAKLCFDTPFNFHITSKNTCTQT